MGIVVVASFAARTAGAVLRDDDVDFEMNQLGREVGEPLILPLRTSVLDDDVLALDLTELAQPLPECLDAPGGAASDARYPIRYTFPAGCASAASGAARRPPASVPMNARRSTLDHLIRAQAAGAIAARFANRWGVRRLPGG